MFLKCWFAVLSKEGENYTRKDIISVKPLEGCQRQDSANMNELDLSGRELSRGNYKYICYQEYKFGDRKLR